MVITNKCMRTTIDHGNIGLGRCIVSSCGVGQFGQNMPYDWYHWLLDYKHNDSTHVHSNSSGRNILGHVARSSVGKCTVCDMPFVVVGQVRLEANSHSFDWWNKLKQCLQRLALAWPVKARFQSVVSIVDHLQFGWEAACCLKCLS